MNGVQASSTSAQPSSSVRYDPLTSPQRWSASIASHRSGSSRSRNRRNWRTCHVGASRSTYSTRSRPTRPTAVHASLSHDRLNVSVWSPSHVDQDDLVPVGRERRQAPSRVRHRVLSIGARSSRRRPYGEAVISLADAQRVVIDACPPLTPVTTAAHRRRRPRAGRRRGRRRGRPAVRQQRRRRLRRRRRRHRRATGASSRSSASWPPERRRRRLPISPGQTIRIMTGAPMPAGADAVVMVEDSELLDGDIVRLTATVHGGHLGARRRRRRASRRRRVRGRHGGHPGRARRARQHQRPVRCGPFREPASAVLSTGDELVTDGAPLAPGQIRETNQTMLAPLLDGGRLHRAAVRRRARRRGDAGADAASARPRRRDAIVTSGGVSMGDYDVVKAVLGRIAEMRWMQVAIKPAKPFAFGTIDGVPVFGLPGNPVSSLVSFELLARPALRRMMGHADPFRPSGPGDRRRWAAAPPRRQGPPRSGRRHVRRRRQAARRAGVRPGEPPAGRHRAGQRPGVVDDGDGIPPAATCRRSF